MRKVKKMGKMVGTLPRIYNRYIIADMCRLMNSYADVIDYLVEVVSDQEKEIEDLKSKVSEHEKEDPSRG